MPSFIQTVEEHPSEDALVEAEIAARAYSYWEARNREGGSADDDWFRAVQELTQERLK
jgi:hypothetical protein